MLYFKLLNIVDGAAVPHPFGDLNAILQGASCWRQGVNVYAPSACMGGGEYNYGLLLLRFLYVLPPRYTAAAGIVIGLCFIGAFSCLPKPSSGYDFVLRTLAALSGSSMFAVERANLDVVIFLLAFAGIFLLSRGFLLKLSGYALFILLAIIKFYPLTLLLLAARERLAVLCWLVPLVFAGGWVFMATQASNVVTVVRILPHDHPFGGTFGAINLFYGFAYFTHQTGAAGQPFDFGLSGAQKDWLHVMQLLSVAIGFLCRTHYQDQLEILDAPRKNLLAAGAAIIAGCFLMVQNNDYRAIFLIWTIPALALLAQQPDPARWQYSRLLGAIIFVLLARFFQYWMTFFSRLFFTGFGLDALYFGFWLLRELIWWWLLIQLVAMLFTLLKPDLTRLLNGMKLTAITGRA